MIYINIFLASLATTVALSACMTAPHKAYTTNQARTVPVRNLTNMDLALSCLDRLLVEYRVQPVYLTSTGLPSRLGDKVGLSSGMDILKNSIGQLSQSKVFYFVDMSSWAMTMPHTVSIDNSIEFLNAQTNSAEFKYPSYIISGSISLIDKDTLSDQMVDSPGTTKQDQMVSVITVDMQVLDSRGSQVLNGLTTRNSLALVRASIGADLIGRVKTVDGYFNVSYDRSEGMHQGVRDLIELGTIELLGKLAKVPYQRCLRAEAPVADAALQDGIGKTSQSASVVIENTPVPAKPPVNHTQPVRPPPSVASLEPLPVPSNPASFGRFIALLIGNDKYQFGKPLDTAVADVQSIKVVLNSKFGFQVTVLTNATRRDILGALENLKNSVDENTNVLIYYAGHGHEEKAETRGYWLPVDAEEKNPDNWIANDDITSKLKAMSARHVLVIADSCYSGSISRGDAFRGARRSEPGGPDSTGYLQKVAMKKSRQVLTSGGEEPVMDGGGKNGHSVFASALLDALQDGTGALDGHLLVEKIRKTISYNAEQNPEFNYIPSSGHDGGEFLFIPRN